ncbi:hypothetical protein CYMTET_36299 [Cymbomonas tetramitiformis]|uniref:Uncharacterized protein n=1 Tax=Cymbomonas tetramitiformis TaxID=36881 RepID=A0AAE0CIH5_9CHLO|nr:hypothetical protein CYMTET_36299 [Cymbomonas tetramitiformis]
MEPSAARKEPEAWNDGMVEPENPASAYLQEPAPLFEGNDPAQENPYMKDWKKLLMTQQRSGSGAAMAAKKEIEAQGSLIFGRAAKVDADPAAMSLPSAGASNLRSRGGGTAESKAIPVEALPIFKPRPVEPPRTLDPPPGSSVSVDKPPRAKGSCLASWILPWRFPGSLIAFLVMLFVLWEEITSVVQDPKAAEFLPKMALETLESTASSVKLTTNAIKSKVAPFVDTSALSSFNLASAVPVENSSSYQPASTAEETAGDEVGSEDGSADEDTAVAVDGAQQAHQSDASEAEAEATADDVADADGVSVADVAAPADDAVEAQAADTELTAEDNEEADKAPQSWTESALDGMPETETYPQQNPSSISSADGGDNADEMPVESVESVESSESGPTVETSGSDSTADVPELTEDAPGVGLEGESNIGMDETGIEKEDSVSLEEEGGDEEDSVTKAALTADKKAKRASSTRAGSRRSGSKTGAPSPPARQRARSTARRAGPREREDAAVERKVRKPKPKSAKDALDDFLEEQGEDFFTLAPEPLPEPPPEVKVKTGGKGGKKSGSSSSKKKKQSAAVDPAEE